MSALDDCSVGFGKKITKKPFFKPSISGIFRENQNFHFNSQKIKLNLLKIKKKIVHFFSDHYLWNGNNMSILGNIFSMCKLPKKKSGPSSQLELACSVFEKLLIARAAIPQAQPYA